MKNNCYKDMECVIHFGENRKQILREFQEGRAKLAARYIEKQEMATLRKIDLFELTVREEKAA